MESSIPGQFFKEASIWIDLIEYQYNLGRNQVTGEGCSTSENTNRSMPDASNAQKIIKILDELKRKIPEMTFDMVTQKKESITQFKKDNVLLFNLENPSGYYLCIIQVVREIENLIALRKDESRKERALLALKEKYINALKPLEEMVSFLKLKYESPLLFSSSFEKPYKEAVMLLDELKSLQKNFKLPLSTVRKNTLKPICIEHIKLIIPFFEVHYGQERVKEVLSEIVNVLLLILSFGLSKYFNHGDHRVIKVEAPETIKPIEHLIENLQEFFDEEARNPYDGKRATFPVFNKQVDIESKDLSF